jgi:hypothetical protein
MLSDPAQTPDQTRSFWQRRRWLKTLFLFAPTHLDYSFASKKDSALHKRLAWDTIAGRSAYFTTIEADRELSWLAFVITALAMVSVLHGGPQPLALLVYAGAMVLGLVVLLLTRKMRQVAFTGIPTADLNILVLDDRKHDAIIEAIEGRRATALRGLAEPDAAISVRTYLRRLRWLVENDVLTEREAFARQKLVLPEGFEIPPVPARGAPASVSFRQRRLGAAIDVELLADRLTCRSALLLGATNSSSVFYRDLKEPSAFYDTDHRYQLTGLIFAWCAIVIFAWMSSVAQSHSEGYYVGNIGLRRALSDFGPALLAMAACAAVVSMLTRLRYAEPYPGVRLLRDRRYDALLAAIEERRIAAQRTLSNPDPLLTLDEQMQLLSELRDNDVVSDEDYQLAAKRAAFVCGNPLLDRPADPQPQKGRQKAMH